MGQAALVGNRRQSTSPWAHTFQDASSDEDRGALYLNLEGVDEEMARAIAQEIARVYFENVTVSTETALLRSVRHAYRQLYDARAAESLGDVGITAVVILDDRASIAQVLPTQFYLIQDDEITALPDAQDRLSGPASPPQSPSSATEGRYPQWEPPVGLFRASPSAQDIAALCTDNIGAVLSASEIQDVVGRGSIQSAAENLVDTARQRGEETASVLLLRFVAVRERVETTEEAPETAAESAFAAQPEPAAQPESAADAAQAPTQSKPRRSGNPLVTFLGLLLALVLLAWSTIASLFRPRGRRSESLPGGASGPATESTIPTRGGPGQDRRQRISRLVAGGAVILLLIALVIAANALFGEQDPAVSVTEDPTATPQAQATATPTQAAAAASPAPAESTPEATPEPPAAAAPGSVQLTASQDLVRFDPTVQQPGEIYGLDNTVYVIDRASGAVYRVGSDGSNEIAYQPDAATGSAARHVTGREGVIQILDTDNRLFHVTNEAAPQLVELPVGSVEQPRSTATYDENFYVLDTAANDVLRFRPVGSGVYSEPEGYFGVNSGVDLAQATDLAIDGSVYILFSDGTVNRYIGGARADFSLATLPSPVGVPGVIFISQGMGSLYILDGDNGRIVQVTTEGVYQRQFLAPDGVISNTLDLYVNEDETSLWLVSPTGVTRYPLPTLPEDAPRSPE